MNETIGHVFYRSYRWESNPTVSSQRSIRWILDHFLMIGVIRMRQVRVKPEKCNIPKSYSDEIADCYPAYSTSKKDTDPCKFSIYSNNISLSKVYMTIILEILPIINHRVDIVSIDCTILI